MESTTVQTARGRRIGPEHTVITWEEYRQLCRDREILDWVERDWARNARSAGGRVMPPLRRIVGQLLDSGADLQATIKEAALSMVRKAAPGPREGLPEAGE